MKYWKGRAGAEKEGQFGTMDDDGHVPGSIACTKAEYEAYIASLPVPPPAKPKVLKLKNIETGTVTEFEVVVADS